MAPERVEWHSGVAEAFLNNPTCTGVYLGIDPSLTGTGLAVVGVDDSNQELFYSVHTVKTAGLSETERLERIYNALGAYMPPVRGTCMEDLPRNAMSAGQTGQAQGVLRLAVRSLPHSNNDFHTVAPSTLKKFATGNGRADKGAMMEAVEAVNMPVDDDNQADALSLALLARSLRETPSRSSEVKVKLVETFAEPVEGA